MFESINTLLLTLSQSPDCDRADSLRPKELRFYCTTDLGLTAIAHQLGLFLPWLRSFCGESRDSTETCLSERPSGSTTNTIVRDFRLRIERGASHELTKLFSGILLKRIVVLRCELRSRLLSKVLTCVKSSLDCKNEHLFPIRLELCSSAFDFKIFILFIRRQLRCLIF
jgi:hypothetical protein